MTFDRDDIAAAIASADIGGWGSTLDLDEAVDNVLALIETARAGAERSDAGASSATSAEVGQ